MLKKKDPTHILLVNNNYKLPEEIHVALGDEREISLVHHWVEKYIEGNINPNELTPRYLVSKIEAELRESISLEEDTYILLSLWIYGTYYYQLFFYYPYLLVSDNSLEKIDKLTELLYKLCFNAKKISGLDPKGIVTSITREGGTFIFREPNNYVRQTKRTMVQLIANGCSSLGHHLESERIGETYTLNRCTIYSPKIFIRASEYENLIKDKSIKVDINGLLPCSYDPYEKADFYKELSSKCCLSALVNFIELYNKYLQTPRTNELMRPMMALAKLIGSKYDGV